MHGSLIFITLLIIKYKIQSPLSFENLSRHLTGSDAAGPITLILDDSG